MGPPHREAQVGAPDLDFAILPCACLEIRRAPLPLSSPRRRCRFMARSPRPAPRPESLILMILSDKLIRGVSFILLFRVSQIWTWIRAPLKQRGSGWCSRFGHRPLRHQLVDQDFGLEGTKFKIEPGWLPRCLDLSWRREAPLPLSSEEE